MPEQTNAAAPAKDTTRQLTETDDAFMAPYGPLAFFLDLDPAISDFRSDVLAGLAADVKSLSPKYLYDERGSQIFDEITRLAAYYPTRTERAIMDEHARDIAAAIGPRRAVFEYGSGSSEKIRALIDCMIEPQGYVAMDISRDHLLASARALAGDLSLPVGAVCADFTVPLTLPEAARPAGAGWLGYFPGSTIGNLSQDEAAAFLANASRTLGPNALFLLGVDLEKDPDILRAAYDDDAGVTARFNLNLLTHMQRALNATIDVEAFAHEVMIPDDPQRVEMHLRAQRPTDIVIDDRVFHFETGESLHTENSHKYALARLDKLLDRTPWRRIDSWTDEKGWFATCLLSNR